MPYAKIENNTFAIHTIAGIGIFMDDTGGVNTGKGYVVRDNEFIGNNVTTVTTVGIVMVGTRNAVGFGLIRTNYFAYCADAAITLDKLGYGAMRNFGGDTAGGALIDSV